MGLLDALIYGLRDVFDLDGAQLPRRSRIKFLAAVTDDPINDQLIVALGGGASGSAAPITNSGTGNLNDVPTQTLGVDADIIRFTGADPNVSGFEAGSGGSRFLVARALGGPVDFYNANPGSSVGNRIFTGTGDTVTLPANGTALFKFDPTSGYWSLVGIISTAVPIVGNENEILTKVGDVPTGATGVRAKPGCIVFGSDVDADTGVGFMRFPASPTDVMEFIDTMNPTGLGGGPRRAVLYQVGDTLAFGDYYAWNAIIAQGKSIYLSAGQGSTLLVNSRVAWQAVATPAAPADMLLTGFPRYGYNSPIGASEGRSLITAAPPYTLVASEYMYAEIAFVHASAGTYTFPSTGGYQIVHFKWLTNLSGTDKVISNGGPTTYTLVAGTDAWVRFSPDGVFSASGAGGSMTMSSAGGTASVYKALSGSNFVLRGISPGTNSPITVTQNTNDVALGFASGTAGQLLRHNGTTWVAGNRANFIALHPDEGTATAASGLVRVANNVGNVLTVKDTLGVDAPMINTTTNNQVFGDPRGGAGGMAVALMGSGIVTVGTTGVGSSFYQNINNANIVLLTDDAIYSARPRLGFFAPYASEGRIGISGGGHTLTASEYLYYKIRIDGVGENTYVFPHPVDDAHAYFKLVENSTVGTTIYISTGTGAQVSLGGTASQLLEFTTSGVKRAVNSISYP